MDPQPLLALTALAIGAIGAAVANLQAFLARLNLADIPPEERAGQAYKDGTAKAVRTLQDKLNLQVPRAGEVDDRTARAANEFAVEHGILFAVSGRVAAADGTPAAGLTVRVADSDNLDLACAEVVSDAGGQYVAFYDPAFYLLARPGVARRKEVVDLVVRAFDAAGAVKARSATLQRPDRKVTVDLKLESAPADRIAGLRVRGTVVDAQGRPLDAIQIDVFDRDIGEPAQSDQRLGDSNQRYVTDSKGAFEIPYALADFKAGDAELNGRITADLIFRLNQGGRPIEHVQIVRLPVDGDPSITFELPFPDDEQILGIVARDDEAVRIVADVGVPVRGVSEFETLLQALAPLTGKRALADFDEPGTRDVTFAAREIGREAMLIADIVTAHRLAIVPFVGASPAALYAMARLLGARDPRLIATRRADELAAALTAAVQSAIIPAFDGDAGRIAGDIHAVAIRETLALKLDAGGSLNDVLSGALPEPAARAALLEASVNHTGDTTQFWSAFSASHPTLDIAPVQYALHLSTLTDRNVPLMTALQQKVPAATSMRSLAFHLDPAALSTMILDSGAMPTTLLEGETADAARTRLSGEISGLLEASQPTAVVARLANGWHGAAPDVVAAPAAALLTSAVLNTDFDMATGSVDALVDKHAAVLFNGEGADVRLAAVDGVKRIQRLFQISPDPATLGLVATRQSGAGFAFRGALDIARFGKTAFINHFAGATADAKVSLAFMHDRSRAVAETISQLIVGQHQDMRDAKPAAAATAVVQPAAPAASPAGPPAPGPAAVPPGVDNIPSWADFFGGAEVCECSDCRSVVGPAAYVVDCLEFLDKRCDPGPTGVTPRDVLIGHPTKSLKAGDPPGIVGLRPDLAHIKLSCENTNTTIPTIDLINEILESVVAFGQTIPLAVDSTGNAVVPHVLAPNELSSGVTGPELSAAPEHVVESAYRIVGEAVFPVRLPYNRLLATARANIRQAGSTRADVIRLFGPSDATLRAAAAAADTLGLLAREVEILTGAAIDGAASPIPIPTETLYGLPPAPAGDMSWLTANAKVRGVLTALDVSFEDLIALLRTRFIGGEVPSGNEAEVGSRLFLDVDQLKAFVDGGFTADEGVALALKRGGLTTDDVKAFVTERSGRLATTLVLDPPLSCDPDVLRLVHLDASQVTEPEWLALHRFVRLSKRSGLSFGELDVALFAAAGAAARPKLDMATLEPLAELMDLAALLDVPVPVAASLVADIDTHGAESLYDAIFGVRGLARVHPLFRRGPAGEVFAVRAPIADGVAGLAAAFSESPARITDMIARLALTDLDLASVSQIHRTLILARTLGVPPAGVIRTRALLDPVAAGAAATPAGVRRFVERARRFAASGFDAATLSYVVGAEVSKEDAAGRPPAELAAIVGTLDAALAPLRDLDEAERAEEIPLGLPGEDPPFSAVEIAQRTANGLGRRRAAAASHLSQAFALDPAILSRFIDDTLVAGVTRPALFRSGAALADPALAFFAEPIVAGNRAEADRLLLGLERAKVLVAAAALTPASFDLATAEAGLLPAAVLTSLAQAPDRDTALESLDRLARFVNLSSEIKRPAALSTVITALAASAGADWSDETFAAAGAWLDITADVVKAVPRTSAPELAVAAARVAPVDALIALRARVTVARRLGVAAGAIADVIAEPISPEALAMLVAGVRSHYDVSTWLDVSRQLSDPIREASRDALVAFLLKREGLQSADQLFSLYLINTQTNSFVLTSPIRQAMFAIQTYVQRCQMGRMVDRGVRPEQIGDEWDTISLFQVWAARLKGLLWPEELLDPAWRDDKTKLFRDFESTIRQADVTPANAGRAVGLYVDDFRVVASVEVCGTFLQTVFEGQETGQFDSVLHVVGRTRGGVPRKYFYRRLNRHEFYQEWTSWEPITTDIQGVERDRPGSRKQGSEAPLYEPGVHVLPVVWRGQVHLFWPTLVRKVDEPSTELKMDSKNPVLQGRFSKQYWEMKLCWTRRDGGAWTPKEQSSALIETWWQSEFFSATPQGNGIVLIASVLPQVPDPQFPDPNQLVLKAQIQPDQQSLQILVAERNASLQARRRFVFSFDRVASEMTSAPSSGVTAGDHPPFSSSGMTGSYMGFAGSGALNVTPPGKPEGDRLFSAPDAFRLTTLNQSYAVPSEAPFFVGVSDRTYFATPSVGTTTVKQEVASSAPAPKASAFADAAAAKAVIGDALAATSVRAKADLNPWLRSDGLKISAATAAAVQSVPALDIGIALAKPVLMVDSGVIARLGQGYRTVQVPTVDVAVAPFFHPFAEQFATTLKRDGLDALLAPEMQRLSLLPGQTFAGLCNPNTARVKAPATEGVDFDSRSAYGTYNWELFFHAPMVIALKLADGNQLEAALDMVHHVFDSLGAGSDPEDAWRFQGLRGVASMNLDNMLALLSRPDGDPGKLEVLAQIEAVRLYPFQAHRIARLRPVAYKKWTVAQCVRLGVAIGDRGLRRFTPEDVNYAIPFYLVAAAEMGRRPETVPQRAAMPSRTYAELMPDLDALGNVFFEAETRLAPLTAGSGSSTTGTASAGVLQRGAIGYFGIPQNDKMLALWDLVEDRLYKIRNGMNIDGVQIQLPLFPPPIDPALFAQALGTGSTLADVMSALSAAPPLYKYRAAYRQATELAELVVRIGASLTSTREKRDGEELALMRATHEKTMSDLLRQLREQQIAEAEANRDAIKAERDAPFSRWSHYRDLLGAVDVPAPGPDPAQPTTIRSGRALPKRPLNLVDASTIEFESLSVIPGAAAGLALAAGQGVAAAGAADTGGIQLAGGNVLLEEKQELQESFAAVKNTFEAASLDLLAGMFSLIPNFEAAVKPLGAGAAVHFGGQALAAQVSALSRNKHAEGSMHTFLSSVYGKQAGFVLRERDWVTQMNTAAADVLSVDRKLILAELQILSARHQQAMQAKAELDAKEIETHLIEKFTSVELQDYHIARQRQLFKRFFDTALDRVKNTALAFAAERGGAAPVVTVGGSDDPRFELTAGYELLACLTDMDRNWTAGAVRKPELVRHVSLKQLDPWALHSLRETGEATFRIPEVLFDMDHPGDYDRRIRSVQLTMPCVTGPYVPVTGTLTLVSSRRRRKAGLTDSGLETDTESGQPSISLSSCRDDSGMFELSLQDERFLPFEGRGLDSTWKIRLPTTVRQFNYRTAISDLMMTFRYVSERGGEKFGADVSKQIASALGKLKLNADGDGPYQLVSARHDFPDAWFRYQAGQGLTVNLATDMLPFALRSGMKPKLEKVHAIELPKDAAAAPPKDVPIVNAAIGWSLAVEAAGAPADVDDIYLLTRFKLS